MRLGRFIRHAVVIAALASTAACGTASRFEWGNYETALFVYSKKPDQRPLYKKSLEAAIEKGRRDNRIAPGLLAELGYLYMEDGDSQRAIALFKEEMTLFPESRPFLGRIVERLQGGQSQSEGNP